MPKTVYAQLFFSHLKKDTQLIFTATKSKKGTLIVALELMCVCVCDYKYCCYFNDQ